MIDQQLCFRPSIVLFVHEKGQKVYQHFRGIRELAHLNTQLNTGIGMMGVEFDAAGVATATPFPPDVDFPAKMPDQPGTLEQLVVDMVKYVQGISAQQIIMNEGYAAPAPVQIYIVGAAEDPWLGTILKTAQEQLRQIRFASSICYILDCTSVIQGMAGAATPALPIDWSQREIADFSILFDDRINYPSVSFIGEDELRHYMMAQTIFALVATSITIDTNFSAIIKAPPGSTYDKLGSMRTSIVSFPRAAIERYCNARFGARLLHDWLTSLQQAKISAEESEHERSQARDVVEAMKEWFKDSVPRPNSHPDGLQEIPTEEGKSNAQNAFDVHLWPTLDILRTRTPLLSDYEAQDQQRLHEQLSEETSRLFGLFLHEEVEQEYQQYRHASRSRGDIAYDRAGKAPDLYVTWEIRAEAAWARIEERLKAQIRESIDQKWPKGDNGVALSRIYVDEYNEQLKQLDDSMIALRKKHEDSYKEGLHSYRDKATPWMNQPNASAFLGPNQSAGIVPQLPGQTQNAASGVGGMTGGTAPTPQQGTGPLDQYLTPEEESIAKALKERIKTYYASIPTWSSAVSSVALSVAGVGLPLLAFIPPALAAYPLAMIVGLASTALGGITHTMLRARQQKRARAAESDLLKFFALCFAYRCERFEDEQRVMTLGPVRRWVHKRLQRLEDMEVFISDTSASLEKAAQDTEQALFDSPAALFDIFVAYGSLLQKQHSGRNNQANQITLNDVFEMIVDQCKVNSEAGLEWHNTSDTMRKTFFASFQKGPNLLEMSDAEAEEHINTFVHQQIVSHYLAKAPSDVHKALQEKKVQQQVEQHMQGPLFQMTGAMKPYQRFICGWKKIDAANDASSQVTDTSFAMTDEHEWYLYVAVFYGNTPFEIDIDALLPPR